MENKSFRHMDPDEYHGKALTLHDCIAEKILFEKNTLRFYLPDGFWVTPHHKENPSGKTVRTDTAVVAFSVEEMDDITVCVFTRNTWCWSRKTCVENWHMEQLMAAVNSGKCTLEFLTQYRSHYEQLWHCVIHSEKRPYYRECRYAEFLMTKQKFINQWLRPRARATAANTI